MVRVSWISFHNYSGCRIHGTLKVSPPTDTLHMSRAYYLTAMLEAPKFGSVQSYDGAAMSGGPMHNIAVYPRGLKQGSMFPLLRALEVIEEHSTAIKDLWAAYAQVGWFVARDGKLRNWNTGKEISGKEIRDEFTPLGGKVPRSGAAWKRAKRWALLHHRVFSDPNTFKAQRNFAIDYLLRTQKSYEDAFYVDQGLDTATLRVWTPEEESLFEGKKMTEAVYQNNLTLAEDLAMCMYHAHSVNGPAPARTILRKTLKRFSRGKNFASLLIWTLGTKKYGRWADTLDGKNRYDRTRYHAKKSGLWPAKFFSGSSALMPATLPKKRPV